MNTRSLLLVVVVSVSAVISACGGGGGGGSGGVGTAPVAPTPVTVVCPNGTIQTAVSAQAANLACPLSLMAATYVTTSVTQSTRSLTTSPDYLTGIVAMFDSTLDPNSLVASLKIGAVPVSGNITPVSGVVPGCTAASVGFSTTTGAVCGSNIYGIKFVPSTKLMFGQAYDFTATVKDTLGRVLTAASVVTMTPVTCVLPQEWNGTTCAVPGAAPAPAPAPAPVLPVGPQSCALPTIWNGTICADPHLACVPPLVWNGTACAVHVP